MIIYNPHNLQILKERLPEAQGLLNQLPVKHCFITGSFLYKKEYGDIDIFIITRSKKKFALPNKKAKITYIDFNNLHSLFYHSLSQSCVAKNILPQFSLKLTLSDYWQIINEAIPTVFNQKNTFQKEVRFLVLYTEYFKCGQVLDTFQLAEKIKTFKEYGQVLTYIKESVPKIIQSMAKPTYTKRFFYTQAGFYKEAQKYEAQNFLYGLTHEIIRGVAVG